MPRVVESHRAQNADDKRATNKPPDLISRVRILAETDMRRVVNVECSSALLHIRELGQYDGSRFYDAEACGWYQMYEASESSGVSPIGIDVFTVWLEGAELRVASGPPDSSRPMTIAERITVIGFRGAVCRAPLARARDTGNLILDGCREARAELDPKHVTALQWSLLAIRESDATQQAVVRHHDDFVANNWVAHVVIDLAGDDTQRVEVWCRTLAVGHECERLMVQYDKGGQRPLNIVLASRARW
jgi:hypothetical protein